MKRNKFKYLGLILTIIFVLTLAGCDLWNDDDDKIDQYTLSILIEGEGETDPGEGEHRFDKESIVEISAVPEDDWDFYDWTGLNAGDIVKEASVYKIKMDEDKEITAFFANEYFEMEIDGIFFSNSAGTIHDLTNNPPYPPGFKVELEAVPATENDAFLFWAVELLDENNAGVFNTTSTQVDPRDYFEDYESRITKFTVPEQNSLVRAYFNTRTPPPEDFNYFYEDFGLIIGGGYGVHFDFWDMGELTPGDEVNFHFWAMTEPDRFRVYYGDENLFDSLYFDEFKNDYKVFDSGFVSDAPGGYQNDPLYPEGVEYHDWHEDVEVEDMITGRNSGVYEAIIVKEAGYNVLLIEVEGRSSTTLWRYVVIENE